MKSSRTNERGAATGLVIVCGLVLVLVVWCAFEMLMYFGGSKEVHNAADSGALNVGKRSFEVKVDAANADENQFLDVADSQGRFGLVNINRVWGKAMLVAANVEAMGGQKTPTAESNADKIFIGAKGLSDKLASKLNTPANLHDYFTEFSEQNSVRMLGNNAKMTVEQTNWETSLVNRGIETNIEITSEQFPSGATFNSVGSVEKAVKGQNKRFVPGYKPINILNKNFCLVPFKAEERTHIISIGQFEGDELSAKPLPEWANPVPNSFSCNGRTINNAQYGQSSLSCVLVNPQRSFKLSIPNGYIKIKLKEKSTAQWYHNGIPWPQTTEYDYVIPENSTRGPGVAGVGTITGTCTFGLEYIEKTVYGALFALPTEDYDSVKNKLVQRVREIDPDFQEGDLHGLLSTPLLPAAADMDNDDDNTVYIIFKTADGLKCLPQPAAQALAPQVNFNHDADGSESEVINESPLWVPGVPGVCFGTPVGFGTPVDAPDFMLIEGSLHWKPGSGYDGCLGEVRLERGTDAFINGIVVFP